MLGSIRMNPSLFDREEYSPVEVKRWYIVSCVQGVVFLGTRSAILHVDTSRIILYYMHLQI